MKMKKAYLLPLFLFIILFGVLGVVGANDQLTILDENMATNSDAEGTLTKVYLGDGSWKATPGFDSNNDGYDKFEYYAYWSGSPEYLGTFTISDIKSITYHTNKLGTQGDPDFYLAIYTEPDSNDDEGWYGYRLNAEPYFSNNLDAPADQWNEWNTNDGTNQLTFFDSWKSEVYGFYGQPDLQDLQAGTINWQVDYGYGVNQDINYGSETIKGISFQTGSGWSDTFEGYLDYITIELTNGKKLTIDLEKDIPSEIYVDDDDETCDGNYPCYDNIQDAINAVAEGGTVNVGAGTYNENVVINKKLILQGEGKETTEIKFGYVSYPSLQPLVISADEVTVSGFTIRSGPYVEKDPFTTAVGGYAHTIIVDGDSSLLTDLHVIKDPLLDYNDNPRDGGSAFWLAPSLDGFTLTNSIVESEWNGIYAREEGSNITVRNVNFTYLGTYAIMLKQITGATIEGNIFTNTGNELGLLVSRGCEGIEIMDNKFTGSGSSESSHIGILLQNFKTGPMGVSILGNDISDFDIGIKVEEDVATSGIHINYNAITGNTYGVKKEGPNIVNAENNYWGTNDGGVIATMIVGLVDYDPWITQGQDTVTTIAGEPEVVDTTGTDTEMTITTETEQTGTVTVQQSSSDPKGGFSVSALGKFISIESDIPNGEIDEVEIRIYYSDEELIASGIDETTLRLYWWDGDSWEVLDNTGVNTVENYVWAITDHFSDYGAGGDPDTEGPSITAVYLEPLFPNLLSTLVKIFATITDPSGVDYSTLYYQIGDEDVESTTFTGPFAGGYAGIVNGEPEDGVLVKYRIKAADNLGLYTLSPGPTELDWYNFTYDGSAPTTSDDAPVSWVNTNVTVTLTCDDIISGCVETYYSTDGSDPETLYTGPFTLTETGQYQLKYYSIDNAGNEEDAVMGTLVKIDKEISTITDNYDVYEGVWVNEDQTVTLTPGDIGGSELKEVKWCTGTSCDPGAVLSSPYELIFDTSQNTIVRYQAFDNAGNPSEIGEFNVKLDKIIPITSDDVPANWRTSIFNVTLTVTDDGFSSTTTYYKVWLIEGTEPTEWNLGKIISITVDGEYNIKYYSEDEAGNIEEENIGSNIARLDTIEPSLTLQSLSDIYAEDFTLQITESDETSGLDVCEYKVNSGTWTPRTCESGSLLITVGIGEECDTEGINICEVEVRTTDYAGNTVTQSKVFSIDWSNPPQVLNSGPSGTIVNSWTELNVETNKPAICKYDTVYKSSYSVMSYDMETTGGTMSSQTITGLKDQSYAYYVLCKDNAGNEMTQPVSILFDVDTRETFNVTIPETKGDYLRQGWNQFFLPSLVLENTTLTSPFEVEEVLASIEGDYIMVYHFDGTGWKSYVPERDVNDLLEFNGGGFPYFIYMDVSGERIEIE